MTGHLAGWTLVALLGPVVAVAVGAWVYRDARRHGHGDRAPWVALAVGGLFLTGSLPGLVALAVTAEPAAQGFPTAIRIVPGIVALVAYAHFR